MREVLTCSIGCSIFRAMLKSPNTAVPLAARFPLLGWVLLATLAAAGCSPDPLSPELGKLTGPLISSKTTMVTAWEYPNDPLTDPTLGNSRVADQIRLGFRIFTNTPVEAAEPEDGIWARHWYHAVHKSTGFAPYERKHGFPDEI